MFKLPPILGGVGVKGRLGLCRFLTLYQAGFILFASLQLPTRGFLLLPLSAPRSAVLPRRGAAGRWSCAQPRRPSAAIADRAAGTSSLKTQNVGGKLGTELLRGCLDSSPAQPLAVGLGVSPSALLPAAQLHPATPQLHPALPLPRPQSCHLLLEAVFSQSGEKDQGMWRVPSMASMTYYFCGLKKCIKK